MLIKQFNKSTYEFQDTFFNKMLNMSSDIKIIYKLNNINYVNKNLEIQYFQSRPFSSLIDIFLKLFL